MSVFIVKEDTSTLLGILHGFANGTSEACTTRPLCRLHVLVLLDEGLVDPVYQISASVCGYQFVCIKFYIFNTYFLFTYFHISQTCTYMYIKFTQSPDQLLRNIGTRKTHLIPNPPGMDTLPRHFQTMTISIDRLCHHLFNQCSVFILLCKHMKAFEFH